MLKRDAILVTSICLMVSSQLVAGALEAKASGGSCHVHGQLTPQISIDLVVKMRPSKNKPVSSSDSGGWSDDFFGNLLPIEHVGMKINGQDVLIPNSAFADLASVKSLKVSQSESAILVTAACGQGGDSETVVFTIERSKRMPGKYQISERILRADGFEDDVWERTIYHNNVWDNPNL